MLKLSMSSVQVEQLFNIQMEDLLSIAMIRMRRSFIHVNLNFNTELAQLCPSSRKYPVQQLQSMLYLLLTLGDLERTLGWEDNYDGTKAFFLMITKESIDSRPKIRRS